MKRVLAWQDFRLQIKLLEAHGTLEQIAEKVLLLFHVVWRACVLADGCAIAAATAMMMMMAGFVKCRSQWPSADDNARRPFKWK